MRVGVAAEFKRFNTEGIEERRRTQRKITAFTAETLRTQRKATEILRCTQDDDAQI